MIAVPFAPAARLLIACCPFALRSLIACCPFAYGSGSLSVRIISHFRRNEKVFFRIHFIISEMWTFLHFPVSD